MRLSTFIPGSPGFPIRVNQFAAWINRCFSESGKCGMVYFILMAVYYFGVYLSVVTRKVQIEESVSLGPGLWLSPKGRIIIGARKIGANCRIHHNVTIGFGFNTTGIRGLPILGDNVKIGANTLIYGDIYIGDNVNIEEGSIVTKSIPSGCRAKGNPCKIIRR